MIHHEIARVEQTVQGLLDFARLPKPARQLCDVRPLVARAVELVQARARQQQIDVSVRAPEAPLPGNVDPNQIGTVLVNLLLNALDAMPRGGRVEVTLDSSDDGNIRCAVSDTGPGIAPEMMDQLFVPFSSSKATGTGLGLSICRRILEEHGGQILGQNRAGGGASFLVTLPRASGGLPDSLLPADALALR